MEKIRCVWAGREKIYRDYHDREWGRPVRDDRRLFEFFLLEGMQAGLSWLTVLKKRENFRQAFSGFDPVAVAAYTEADVERLLADPGIIRNRLKIRAAIENARAFLVIQAEFGSFSDYLWRFTGGQPIRNHWPRIEDVPARSDLSDKISGDLKKRGCKFAGSTICYAFMQAVGLVNDHTADCFLAGEDL